MSLPDEQARALVNAKHFLLDLCVPGKIKRIPSEVRQMARCLVKHYPCSWDLPRLVNDKFSMRQMERHEEKYRQQFWDQVHK